MQTFSSGWFTDRKQYRFLFEEIKKLGYKASMMLNGS